MSDTTEYCPVCDGEVIYPTDWLGRVRACCAQCGRGLPTFSPRSARPNLSLHRPSWTNHEIEQWVRVRVRKPGASLPRLLQDAEQSGLSVSRVRVLVERFRVARAVTARSQTLVGQVEAWAQGRDWWRTADLKAAFPAVDGKTLAAVASTLAARGKCEKGGTREARQYRWVGRPTQEAA
jgi:hypothetical protein